MPTPIKCSPKSEISDFRKLIHQVAIIGEKDDRVYDGSAETRATMRIYCRKPDGGTKVVGTANLMADQKTILTAAHVLFHNDCSPKEKIEGCFLLETNDGSEMNYVEFEPYNLELGFQCPPGPNGIGDDWLKLKAKSQVNGISGYEANFSKELKVGDKVKVISGVADNFGSVKDRRRIVQHCKVILVRENYYGTDCDSGKGSSGSIVLDSSNKAIGILTLERSRYGGVDFRPPGTGNFSAITRIDEQGFSI